MMLIETVMVWVIFHGTQETVLHYSTEQECKDAIEQGLPYINVPPKSELNCKYVPDHPRIAPRP
jgi:hypothetical protein